jgi:hypothetical protein
MVVGVEGPREDLRSSRANDTGGLLPCWRTSGPLLDAVLVDKMGEEEMKLPTTARRGEPRTTTAYRRAIIM